MAYNYDDIPLADFVDYQKELFTDTFNFSMDKQYMHRELNKGFDDSYKKLINYIDIGY